MQHAADFYALMRERYRIFLKKECHKDPKPWTHDPILQTYSFCNVFREDDKTTAWFRKKVRNKMKASPKVLQATLIFRWFNRIETAEVLLENDLFKNWDEKKARKVLSKYWEDNPLVGSAYIIRTEQGMSKLDGILYGLSKILPDAEDIAKTMRKEQWTLEQATYKLAEYPYLGNFMAYEVVTDLRHTKLLENASDIMSWANPGPGAARGICRVKGLEIDALSHLSAGSREKLIEGMRELLVLSGDEAYWPERWPNWEMREVEHGLCEFDKYRRVIEGEGRPKARYPGV